MVANLAGGGHGAVTVALGATGALGALALRRAVRLVADATDFTLDERLVAVRNAAYLTSYRVLCAALSVVLILLYIGADGLAWELAPRHLHALLWATLLLGAVLPTAVVSWTQKEV